MASLIQGRHEIFGARHNEHIFVRVGRQAFFRFAGDARNRQLPAQAKGAVAIARAILQGQLGAKTGAAGRGGDGHREVGRARERVGLEGLADAADGSAAFGQRERLGRALGGFVAAL